MVCEYTGQCPPRDTSLEVALPLARSISSQLASSLPSFPRAVHASFRSFLARSLHQPSTLPSSTDTFCLPSIIASTLPLLPPSPTFSLFPPSHPPSLLLPCPLHACLPLAVQPNVHRVCVCLCVCLCVYLVCVSVCLARCTEYCVAPSDAWHRDNGVFIAAAGMWRAVTLCECTPTTNPFLMNSK